jgi:hypothetical protein
MAMRVGSDAFSLDIFAETEFSELNIRAILVPPSADRLFLQLRLASPGTSPASGDSHEHHNRRLLVRQGALYCAW